MSNKSEIKRTINRIINPPVPAPVPSARPAPPVPPKYHDQTLTCVGCQTEFVWSAGDQNYYHKMGMQSAPRWCPPCRQKRREFFKLHPEFDRK
jgi:hypothetical protein